MITITLTPELENVISECAALERTTPELYVLDELRSRHLPAVQMDITQKVTPHTNVDRRELMKLPIFDRRQVLAEQAEKLATHYEEDAEWRDLSQGDIIEY